MNTSKVEMAPTAIEHLERSESTAYAKPISRAYIPDIRLSSRHKTAAERKLVLKCDLIIVPLAALIYFAAYLVSYELYDLAYHSF